ncbi:MAG: ATP-dependent DNA helicase [Deltaproteobacteria bacterium]|nr:ATP-dependent DNA helicase [Deltaproteobacteria bacterium]
MPTCLDPVQEILGPEGSVSRSLEDFEFRPSQLQMACLIKEAIKKKIPAIIEAGTGTGKTLGYLTPIVICGKKTVISTGTKNLQEQIFFKDIPLLSKATGLHIDAMLMKGRKNYLCLHRYHQYFSRPSLLRPDQEQVRERIEKWLKKTEFADRAELPWMMDDSPQWDAISSTSDQCLGSDCIHTEDCFLNSLRRRAAKSRIIIVNHHLFFADLMVKEEGFGEIIPRYQMLVFDEAHNIEEIATSYFGVSLSTNQLVEFVIDAEKQTKDYQQTDKKNLRRHLDLIKTGTEHLREFFNESDDKGRLNAETLDMISMGPAHDIRQGLKHIYKKTGFKALKNNSPQAYVARAGELDLCLEKILSFHDPNWLNWYEKRKKGVVLYASPLDISQSMEDLLYQKVKTIVFTSATLSTNGNFDYLRSRLGLSEDVGKGIYPSHFDFKKQTLMYIPKDLPPPNDPNFGLKIAERITELLKITSGRALVLFTSYHNLNLVHQRLGESIPYTIYKQGDAPRSLLLEKFRRDTHSVLLATGSFWQGVDVPGEALSCLIIDKLPFGSPGDPLLAARIQSIRALGGNPFMEYQLPSAIISLKQGLGRLIRNSSDRGILSILDARMITSRYGRFFFDSLPEIPLCHQLSDIDRFFGRSS